MFRYESTCVFISASFTRIIVQKNTITAEGIGKIARKLSTFAGRTTENTYSPSGE